MNRRSILFVVVSVVVLVILNGLVWRREAQLEDGRRLHLELQEDAMPAAGGDGPLQLRYELAESIARHRGRDDSGGRVVVRVDEREVGRFVRLDREESLDSDELALRWRHRGRITIGPGSCDFDPAHLERAARAVYAELVVDSSGAVLLVGLRDADFDPVGLDCGAGR